MFLTLQLLQYSNTNNNKRIYITPSIQVTLFEGGVTTNHRKKLKVKNHKNMASNIEINYHKIHILIIIKMSYNNICYECKNTKSSSE